QRAEKTNDAREPAFPDSFRGLLDSVRLSPVDDVVEKGRLRALKPVTLPAHRRRLAVKEPCVAVGILSHIGAAFACRLRTVGARIDGTVKFDAAVPGFVEVAV